MVKSAEEIRTFQEFQLANVSSFLPNLLIAPAVWLVFAPINTEIGLINSIALTVASIGIRLIATKQIILTGHELRIGKAALPRTILGKAEAVASEDQFAERGPKLDSRAYLALKSGLPGLVKIEIKDDADPTPYVLLSTRRASELVALING